MLDLFNIYVGGILDMGENNDDRLAMLIVLANFRIPPKSISINRFVKIPGTPLSKQSKSDFKDNDLSDDIDCFDFVRIIATARILMPTSYIRLSAGRSTMSDTYRLYVFFAGANSVFYGERLLTTNNNMTNRDDMLFNRLNLQKEHFIEDSV